MLSLEPADRLGVFGTTGSGKTEFVKKHVLGELLARNARVIALDVKDELSLAGRRRAQTNVGPLPYKYTGSEFFAFPQVVREPNLRLAVVPDERTARACAYTFKRLALALEGLSKEGSGMHTVLLLEETQFWAHYKDDRWKCEELVDAVATMWRDYDVTVVFVSQRAVGVPIDARAQLNQLVSFAQSEPADIDALRLRTALSDPTFHQRVQALQPETHGFELWRAGVQVQTTQDQPEAANGDKAANGERQGSSGTSQQAQPHQDGGDDDGGAVRPGEDHRRDGHKELDLQVRPVRGPQAENLSPVDGASSPPSSSVNRPPGRTKKKPVAAPPPPNPKTKSRRRRRVAA